jgi:hypothetical protein
VHFLNEFQGIFGELSSSPIISYVTLLSLEIISVQEKMTKINTVTTRQLGEMTIVGAFRLLEHSGPLYFKVLSLSLVSRGSLRALHLIWSVPLLLSCSISRPWTHVPTLSVEHVVDRMFKRPTYLFEVFLIDYA